MNAGGWETLPEVSCSPEADDMMPRIRYSLRTLMVFVLLAGSAIALWCVRAPWVEDNNFDLAEAKQWPSNFSADGAKVIGPSALADNAAVICDTNGGRPSVLLGGHEGQVYGALFSPDGTRVVVFSDELAGSRTEDRPGRYHERIWRLRRPEYWWGVAWLPQFWAVVFFGAFFAWSLWRDRRYFRRLDAEYAAALAAKAAAKAQTFSGSGGGE